MKRPLPFILLLGVSALSSGRNATAAPPPQALLLSQGRVQVTVQWQNPYSGQSGTAYALPQNDQFGFLYYSDPDNPEVFVKVLDFGTGSALCFVGGLTDFYYKVTFTMLRTGQTLVFEKPAYQYIGFVDATTLKFPTPATTALTWVSGSTVKVEQLIGDCDWPDQEQRGVCTPTASQTLAKNDVEGTDLGYSFETPNGLMFLFGDTIGAKTLYHAGDTAALSSSTDPGGKLLLDFLTNSNGSTFLIQPPGVVMGADDVPESGITLNGQIDILCSTGADTSLPNPHVNDRVVLTRFDPATKSIATGRTISALPGGHFVHPALHASGTDVLMFGLGDYRASNVYLATVPASSFESGIGTKYFAGLAGGEPVWTDQESGAVPIVVDNPLHHTPPDPPTIGNVSVTTSQDLGLWLMTYDGGRQTPATNGVYFCYAPNPWGPWSEPQLIFNATRDHALGAFIHDPGAVPDDMLHGPTINPTANPPTTTRGGAYAPFQIERFTTVQGRSLTIHYTLSTWNPYTVVRMRSTFEIGRTP